MQEVKILSIGSPSRGKIAILILVNRWLFADCGNGSVGRAQPCQGWGSGFEPRIPLHKNPHSQEWGFLLFIWFFRFSALCRICSARHSLALRLSGISFRKNKLFFFEFLHCNPNVLFMLFGVAFLCSLLIICVLSPRIGTAICCFGKDKQIDCQNLFNTPLFKLDALWYHSLYSIGAVRPFEWNGTGWRYQTNSFIGGTSRGGCYIERYR